VPTLAHAADPEGAPGYRITNDTDEIDHRAVWRWLSTQSYWAKGRRWEDHWRAVAHSRCFAALDPAGETVAFARVVTDEVTFGWLADVMVLPDHRGKGLGKAIVASVVEDAALAEVERMVLGTRDAHGLYDGYGFVADSQHRFMERRQPPR
jgi:GNAT superfamily N-acetyltransferase